MSRRVSGSRDQPSGLADAAYPAFFWATNRGVQGRDLRP
jgi:hypothetical protein